jgi:hypothetical protein
VIGTWRDANLSGLGEISRVGAPAAVAGVFVATVAVASFGPAWRAVRLEPSTILHTD